jgi:hypothetical protein
MFLVAHWLAVAFWPRARRQAKPILSVIGVAALAYVPLMVLMLRTGAEGVLSTNAPPSISEGLRILEELASGIAPNFFFGTLISDIVTVIGLLCFVSAGAELLSRIRSVPGDFETVCLGIVVSWLFVPLLVDPVFSLAYRSIFESSFLLQSVPAGAIAMGFVFEEILPKVLSHAFAIGVVTLLVAALVPTYGVSYEPWVWASRYIRTASRPGDCLTVNKLELASNLAYYFSVEGGTGAAPRLVLPAVTWSDVLDPTFRTPAATVSYASVASSCTRLWMVVSRASRSELVGINGEATWFYQHGFKKFAVSKSLGISVGLFAR